MCFFILERGAQNRMVKPFLKSFRTLFEKQLLERMILLIKVCDAIMGSGKAIYRGL